MASARSRSLGKYTSFWNKKIIFNAQDTQEKNNRCQTKASIEDDIIQGKNVGHA
jgi:hypothetical protein